MQHMVRDPSRWHSDYTEHFDIPVGLAVGFNGIKLGEGRFLDCVFLPNQSKTLIVWFAGAAFSPEPPIRLPFLAGMRLAKRIKADHLCIGDASIHPGSDIRLGWYIGCKDYNLQEFHEKLVRNLIGANGYERVIFCGGSGGGFASLEMSDRFAGSLALVFNPQTNIERYNPSVLTQYLQFAFDGEEIVSVQCQYNRKTDLTTASLDSHIVYLQNVSDISHVAKHTQPFWENYQIDSHDYIETGQWIDVRKKNILCLGDWGTGHVAIPTTYVEAILAAVMSCDDSIADILRNDVLTNIIDDVILTKVSA